MGEPYASRIELMSFHTVSKGALGECGLRGGYFEAHNMHPGTIAEMYKCASINLCPNVLGQVGVSLMVNEPKAGSPSFEGYIKEKGDILASLRRKAHMMTDFFNSLEGVECTFTEGAMYSFPTIKCVSPPHTACSVGYHHETQLPSSPAPDLCPVCCYCLCLVVPSFSLQPRTTAPVAAVALVATLAPHPALLPQYRSAIAL
jgi:hypothetical protein